jgi:DoxX-like family
MSTAYTIVTLMTIAASTCFAAADFMRSPFVLANMAKLGVPESYLPMLGILKAAGAAGLLLGLFGVSLIGSAAAIGLVMFFTGAIATHLRAHDNSYGVAAASLLLALATLGLGVASSPATQQHLEMVIP